MSHSDAPMRPLAGNETDDTMTPRTKLRIAAEARLARTPASTAALTPEEVQRALHELQVHHLELEMQNEELRRSHAELDVARQRYFDLYDFAPVGYLTLSESGRIVEANLTAATLLGVARSALVKQALSRFILKGDQDVYYLHRKELVASDERHCCELRMMKIDAAVIWVRLESSVRRDAHGALESRCVLSDITERKHTERALREWSVTLEQRVAARTLELHDSEARFRKLAEATFEGIFISEGGILIDGNHRGGEIHGHELTEMLGRPLLDFVAPQSRAVVAAHIRKASDETYEYLGLRKDGSIFPAEVHGRTDIWQGRVMRIAVMRDITAAKAVAAKLRAQQAELAHAQNLALVSEVSAGIIHQLGQPLSAIGANLSAMTKLKAAELQHCGVLEIIQDVESDVARMRDIVVHLRALADPMHPVRVTSDLNAIVTGVLPLLRQKADHNLVRLVVELGEDLPAVEVDAVQLSQVILNLVRNALEAVQECAPEQRVVVVTTRAEADHRVELCVRDAGTGIASEVMSRLFSPFFSTKADGLGVGLRLSQTIVHAHRGSIEGFNNPGGVGATFRIVLPTPQSGKKRRAGR
jgi:PAS domain S-box-containing protein